MSAWPLGTCEVLLSPFCHILRLNSRTWLTHLKVWNTQCCNRQISLTFTACNYVRVFTKIIWKCFLKINILIARLFLRSTWLFFLYYKPTCHHVVNLVFHHIHYFLNAHLLAVINADTDISEKANISHCFSIAPLLFLVLPWDEHGHTHVVHAVFQLHVLKALRLTDGATTSYFHVAPWHSL